VAHALTGTLNELKIPQKNIAIASGIGCSGRFPVFMKSYGFHGVHGRALPIATGIKLGNPSLTVFAVGGDGDGLGIGGGHLPHATRNNIDITYLLLDNAIYGLTKGQTSPTAEVGTISKSTPFGSEGIPLNAVQMVLSYGGSFVARAFSGFPHEMKTLFKEAVMHRGFSFVHILSPCVMFNKQQTYEFFFEKCRPFRKSYKPDDLEKSMRFALQDKYLYTGIFYRESRKPFELDS
jgi:2-oxoglutarate ferredoxin oxidoreductase subunit beta